MLKIKSFLKHLPLVIIVVLTLIGISCQPQYKTKLIYSCDFSSKDDLNDWKMEGPGVAKIENGKLLLHSKYYDDVQTYFNENNNNFSGNGEDYYDPVETAMRADLGDDVKNYYYDNKFKGGHLVYWNRFITPADYIIEFDFKSLSPNALHMIMFSCTGTEGQDVFSPELKKRWGVAANYTKSDLFNYRISFYSPGRGTSNMRKCPGRILTIKGEDFTLKNPKGTHHLKVVKQGNTVEWFINNQLCFKFEDTLGNQFLKGGQTALRVMVPAKGLYDNYKIYEILRD